MNRKEDWEQETGNGPSFRTRSSSCEAEIIPTASAWCRRCLAAMSGQCLGPSFICNFQFHFSLSTQRSKFSSSTSRCLSGAEMMRSPPGRPFFLFLGSPWQSLTLLERTDCRFLFYSIWSLSVGLLLVHVHIWYSVWSLLF